MVLNESKVFLCGVIGEEGRGNIARVLNEFKSDMDGSDGCNVGV